MNTQLDQTYLNAWRLFITSHARLIARIDQDLAAAGQIPLNWYDVLIELAEAPKHRLRMSELADKVVLSKSGLTRLVDRLEKEGFLRRKRTSEDKRGAYAVLTDQGWEAMRQAWPVYASGIQSYFAHYLNVDEAHLLTEAFSQMLEGLREAE